MLLTIVHIPLRLPCPHEHTLPSLPPPAAPTLPLGSLAWWTHVLSLTLCPQSPRGCTLAPTYLPDCLCDSSTSPFSASTSGFSLQNWMSYLLCHSSLRTTTSHLDRCHVPGFLSPFPLFSTQSPEESCDNMNLLKASVQNPAMVASAVRVTEARATAVTGRAVWVAISSSCHLADLFSFCPPLHFPHPASKNRLFSSPLRDKPQTPQLPSSLTSRLPSQWQPCWFPL